jgi:hypothetical protein
MIFVSAFVSLDWSLRVIEGADHSRRTGRASSRRV